MYWIHTAWESLLLGILVTRVLAHPFNNTTGEECYASCDCSLDQICAEQKCIDPCEGACGPYTVCLVKDRQPMCSCKPGYEGHPFNECKPRKDLECTKDSQCSLDKACMNHKCVDPCQDSCGLNSDCKVINHRRVCACKNGFFYNPIEGCLPVCMSETGLEKLKKFYISDYERDWFGALEDCNIRGMKLATVNNENEWNLLRNSSSDRVWIGGHDFGIFGDFRWVTTGARLSFSKWGSSEPLGDSNHCIASLTVWQSYQCETDFNFACEFF